MGNRAHFINKHLSRLIPAKTHGAAVARWGVGNEKGRHPRGCRPWDVLSSVSVLGGIV
ncbi:hypothetical protein GCM10010349_60440 [Streptomyces flavofungini]|nr:hypothetical protein GCM10010349_60440 [Streptomyces flavofungini]